jgi:GAF domain-containing protein
MTRRTTTGGKAGNARRSKTPKPKRRTTSAGVRHSVASDAGLKEQLDQRTRELHEALERQAATDEVLSVISSSPGELEPVFQAMLENATRICEAKFGVMDYYRDGAFHPAARLNVPTKYSEFMQRRGSYQPTAGSTFEHLIRTKQVVHLPDAAADGPFFSNNAAKLGGARTFIAVPMLKENELIGAIAIYRQEVRPFTDKQIALLQIFAAQAVIAIENARLLSELRESLQRQTATADVLGVISSSPGELGPVFDTMLENATRFCEARFGSLVLFEGNNYRRVGLYNAPAVYVEAMRQQPVMPLSTSVHLSRLIQNKQVLHVNDILAEDPAAGIAALGGARTTMVVPILKENEPVGAISVFRQEVRPFTEKQIELVQNFAAQAVIAIENARLLSELRESLQQQTATSEVLSVISSSPGELEPVFQAMLKNCMSICEAKFGQMFLADKDTVRLVAHFGVPAELARFDLGRGVFQPVPGGPLEQVLRSRELVHVPDMLARYPEYPPVKLGGARSFVAVQMRKDNEVVGIITIYRQEVRPFTDKQIALIENFAAQAVIAIENTRLLSELRESLQQQTATADVLKVISSSPGQLEPVFNAMLENAVRICGAKFGLLFLFEDGGFRTVAMHDVPHAFAEERGREPFLYPPAGSPLGRIMRTRQAAHITDITTEQGHAEGHRALLDLAELGGARTVVAVPMLKDDELVGAVTIYRQEVRPFTDKQIELLTSFAAQAVIAIENTRLLNELRESLEHQTATGEVLSVISQSPTNTQPVFDAIAESAAHLCDAVFTVVWLYDGELLHYASNHNFTAEVLDRIGKTYPRRPDRSLAAGRAILDGKIAHVPDMLADPAYDHEMAIAGNWRASIAVPMLRDGRSVGAISVGKAEAGPFTERQMQLLTTFADQAVIAIENVRLFKEIEEKSRQLAEASQHKSQFLANMSHELRTPLNAILGYTELIADGVYGAPPQKMHAVLKRVESNGKHLLGLINAVLDLSKIEAGQLTLDLADYSLGDVTQTVYSAVEALAMDKKLAFKTDVAPNLPRGRGDARRLAQVLLNLVGNAIKFTDAGEVVISANASNGSFNVSVRDTGPGISSADQAKLFQEFQQADNSITKQKGGTGLGLAISKRIVEMHGCKIWLESQVGQGSTFFVTLPVQVVEQISPRASEVVA